MIYNTKITPVILVPCTKITEVFWLPLFYTRHFIGLNCRTKLKNFVQIGHIQSFGGNYTIISTNFWTCPLWTSSFNFVLQVGQWEFLLLNEDTKTTSVNLVQGNKISEVVLVTYIIKFIYIHVEGVNVSNGIF